MQKSFFFSFIIIDEPILKRRIFAYFKSQFYTLLFLFSWKPFSIFFSLLITNLSKNRNQFHVKLTRNTDKFKLFLIFFNWVDINSSSVLSIFDDNNQLLKYFCKRKCIFNLEIMGKASSILTTIPWSFATHDVWFFSFFL